MNGLGKQFERDLLWAVNSPPLMKLAEFSSGQFPALRSSDIDRDHLVRWLGDTSNRRLGHYFERLIFYWISFIRRCRVVASSQQIIVDKRTKGEIDLLFIDELGRMTHWETAVKFYLHVRQGRKDCFLGPNANDTLQKKWERLSNHQLRLSIDYFPDVEVRQAYVKGRIFYQDTVPLSYAMAGEMNPGHLSGRWVRLKEFSHFVASQEFRYCVLPKPFWLAEQRRDSKHLVFLDSEEIIEEVANHFCRVERPILIGSFDGDSASSIESERFFVVPDNWPTRSSEFKVAKTQGSKKTEYG